MSRRRGPAPWLWLLLTLMGVAQLAVAHEASTSYLHLALRPDGSLTGSLDVGVFDLSWSVALDADGDGRVLWKEVQAAQPGITALVARSITLERGGGRCTLRVTDILVTRHVGEPYLSLPLAGVCPGGGLLAVRSTLLLAEDSGHRTLLEVETPAGTTNGFLAQRTPVWTQPAHASAWGIFAAFLVQGMWHVWTGYDHLAFLLSLLLPCALRVANGRWQPAQSLRSVLKDLLQLVTAFTFAHSITLGLATLQLVTVSPRVIEPLIALTIVVCALFNLVPRLAHLRLPLAFSFGLIHGFGFASALSELEPARGHILLLLAGFNIGVELAQMTVVLLVAPAIAAGRHSPLYATRWMPAASVAVALCGCAWLLARLAR
jgi:hypothetical protein